MSSKKVSDVGLAKKQMELVSISVSEVNEVGGERLPTDLEVVVECRRVTE
jgi:hypothetical protein